MAKTAEGVRVVIYDQEYFIRGELDPEYIQKLGNYLDAKMRSIAGRTRNVDSLRVAVLAGLNIADEHHQLKAKHEAVSQKVGACDQVLNEILRIAG